MPYVRLQTNTTVEDAAALLKKLSATAAAGLGKPEAYVQTALDDRRPMTFAGSDAPTAFIECKSIGLSDNQTAGLSAALSAFCSEEMNIPDDRVYIEFADAKGKMWGWRGSTF